MTDGFTFSSIHTVTHVFLASSHTYTLVDGTLLQGCICEKRRVHCTQYWGPFTASYRKEYLNTSCLKETYLRRALACFKQ